MHRTRIATRWPIALPIAMIILGLTAVDSVYPFRQAYAVSVAEAGQVTDAAREYADPVNAAIPEDCGVLQLPYMAYPEHGVERGVNDYDHFWTSMTNPGKQWSYGAVKLTDAGTWSAQLPQVPTDEQVSLLRGAGFCAIHLDTRGYISEVLAPVQADLTARFGEPVATGFDGAWLLFDIRDVTPASPGDVEAFLRQPFISIDYEHVTVRDTALQTAWWWTRTPSADFVLTPTTDTAPLTSITGGLAGPPCGAVPVTLTLSAPGQSSSETVIASPDEVTPFALALDTPSTEPGVLTVDVPGDGCPVGDLGERQFAQVLDLAPR